MSGLEIELAPKVDAIDDATPSGQGCTVVGIGASAGGLAAFEAFFSGMPADDPGMAFVLVQHLAPDHKSILSDLIRRYTRMEVFEVSDGMVVKPNCAYIIPPNRNMAIANRTLRLLDWDAPRGQRFAIDFFFHSLAQDQHERAICIVLSGTGSDGTSGLRAVKGEGGLAIAQDPASTEYDGMPRSAIDTGLVDYILPPAEMPAQLIAYVAHSSGKNSRSISPADNHLESSLEKIFPLLRTQTGHDFSQYKRNPIARCIERSMAIDGFKQVDDYVRHLEQTPADVEGLCCDLLIGVTSFFRDASAFEALRQQIIPQLFSGKPADSTIRVWVAGCSTGEEAYSIAILLQEQMERLKQNFKLQVFATDINRRAIGVARAAVYPASIAADVSPERLARFMAQDPAGGAFRVHSQIREIVVFSEQDLIKDPPFSKLDLISCRNLMIYLEADLQLKLLHLFHYALKPGGRLFLGSSESVGASTDLFTEMDRTSKLFLRKDDVPGRASSLAAFPLHSHERLVLHPIQQAPVESKPSVRELTERAMLRQYTPAGVLVNERGDILYLHGRTGRYLEPPQGEAEMNILKMAREGLRPSLTIALHKALLNQKPVHQAGISVRTNGNFAVVNLTVRPASAGPDLTSEPRLFLVVFEEVLAMGPKSAPKADVPDSSQDMAEAAGGRASEADRSIAMLKQELLVNQEYLRITAGDLEASNEALKCSNQEMQAINEELQSTNEELETSKEELQSVNEELTTVNAELQTKVADLSRSNNDMNNLLAGTGIGTIFVDRRMRIRHFTASVTRAINLIPTDVGRPVGHIVSNLMKYDRLVADLQSVLDTLTSKEVEVQTQTGAWYLLRMQPYRTLKNAVEGAVITFTEITELRIARAARQDSETLRRLAAVVHDASDAILVQNFEGRILAWNPAAQRMYMWSETEALAMNICSLIPEIDRERELAAVQRQGRGEVLAPYHTQRIAKDGRIVEVMLTATALMNKEGTAYAIATTERQIS